MSEDCWTWELGLCSSNKLHPCTLPPFHGSGDWCSFQGALPHLRYYISCTWSRSSNSCHSSRHHHSETAPCDKACLWTCVSLGTMGLSPELWGRFVAPTGNILNLRCPRNLLWHLEVCDDGCLRQLATFLCSQQRAKFTRMKQDWEVFNNMVCVWICNKMSFQWI